MIVSPNAYVLFRAVDFVVLLQFSQYNIFTELCCYCSAFWYWNLHDPYYQRKLHTNFSLPFLFVWQYQDLSHVWWPKFGWKTSTLVQKSSHQWLNCQKPFCYILDTVSDFFALATQVLFCSSVDKWGIHFAFIFLNCKQWERNPQSGAWEFPFTCCILLLYLQYDRKLLRIAFL